MTFSPPGYVSINDAAAELGVKPWDVVRLLEAYEVKSVTLVELASLRSYKESR